MPLVGTWLFFRVWAASIDMIRKWHTVQVARLIQSRPDQMISPSRNLWHTITDTTNKVRSHKRFLQKQSMPILLRTVIWHGGSGQNCFLAGHLMYVTVLQHGQSIRIQLGKSLFLMDYATKYYAVAPREWKVPDLDSWLCRVWVEPHGRWSVEFVGPWRNISHSCQLAIHICHSLLFAPASRVGKAGFLNGIRYTFILGLCEKVGSWLSISN